VFNVVVHEKVVESSILCEVYSGVAKVVLSLMLCCCCFALLCLSLACTLVA